MRTARIVSALACAAASATAARAQDLEPRAYSASPVGVNFLVVSYSRSTGGIVFDPALPCSDVRATINATAAGIGHTFNLFGKLALVSATVPYVLGDVTGNVGEDRREVARSGLADSRIKLSVNLRGNDAMSPRTFAGAPRHVVLGVSLGTTMPSGQYGGTKLINIGNNRWSLEANSACRCPQSLGSRHLRQQLDLLRQSRLVSRRPRPIRIRS